MRKITLLLFAILMASSFLKASTGGNMGWFDDYLSINVNGTGATSYYIGTTGTGTALQDANFGSVSSLAITACDMKYWSDIQDRTGGAFYYKIMSADGSTQIVAQVETVWNHLGLGGNDYQGTKAIAINLLAGLSPATTYQLHVYAKSWGNSLGDNWLSNSSANYVATFTTSTVMSGTYKVGTAAGASFSSLSSAINTLNSVTVAGDIALEINSDITEAANFGLAKDFGAYKLTIRPDADASRTITFSQLAANVSPYGHFVIGYLTSGLGLAYADASAISTNNVTIDGYAVGGSTKRLKFTTTTDALLNSSLITILGGCTGTTIKNCILDNVSTSATKCIYILQYKGTGVGVDFSPVNTLIENNDITSVPSVASVNGLGIQMGRNTTSATKITNTIIKNNYFLTRGTSLEVYYADGATITGNEFKVRKGTATGISYAVYLRGSAGDMNVIGNKFTELSTSQVSTTGGAWGVFDASLVSGPFNMYVYNNTFTGMDRFATGATAINQCYIASGVNTTSSKIYHNTFYLPALTAPTQAGYYNAIKYTTATRKADIMNNIFISNEDAKSCFISDLNTAGTVNYNLYFLRAGNTNARIVSTYATMKDYRDANPTVDINSKYKDVEFVSTTDLHLTGTSINDIELGVDRLTGVVDKDISGTTSRNTKTYMGAHEASDLTQPIPTKTFTVTVPNGTSRVYVAGTFTGKKWNITTPYELTSTANPNEFTGTFACTNDVTYKYLCDTGDFAYQAAVSAGGAAEANRTYNAADPAVVAWLNMKTVTLNVSFATGVPTKLFVKGSWDTFANPIELTKTGNTFTTTLSGLLGNKIPSNTQYKYYTNDEATDNWESNADNSPRINRWSIYPVMNDEVARFTTAIVSGVNNPLAGVRILPTASGIEVILNGQSTIELLSVNGVLIDKTIANGLYTRQLNHGVYIIRIDGKATKFVK